MKLLCNCTVALALFVCALPLQAADDVRPEQASAMLRADMELYDFYMKHSQGLEFCFKMCPEHVDALENASGKFAVLLDGAVSSIRGEHFEAVNFIEHDSALFESAQKKYSKSNGCSLCLSLAARVQGYVEKGLPASIGRAKLLHTEKYAQSPELEFNDGLIATVRYQWIANGKRRTCRVSVPKTWAKVSATASKRNVEFRSALGNGVPFFSIGYTSAQRVHSAEGILQELKRRSSQQTLSKQFGRIEILAQGVQMLGNTQSVWVMFASDGSDKKSAGYYYNWYMLVDGTVLTFQSGVSGTEEDFAMEQEQLFRKYYETLREIAVSSVIS